jgi:flavin-dependent dehydrogenase
MKAAQFAAETVMESSQKGDFTAKQLEAFDDRVNKSALGSDMTRGLPLRKMFLDDDTKQEISVGMTIKDPKFAETIAKLIVGFVPYKTFIP